MWQTPWVGVGVRAGVTYLYSALAALAAVVCEIYYKGNPHSSWLTLAPLGVPLALLVNIGIYGTLHAGESLLGLAVVFSLCTASLRVAWTLIHGDPVNGATWTAFCLIVLASLVRAVWK